MLLRSLVNRFPAVKEALRPAISHARPYSSYYEKSKDFQVDKNWHRKEYVTLKLNRAPVNSFNVDFLKDLVYQIEMFEETETLKGVIISSDITKVFSAGIDLMELYDPDPHRVEDLWIHVQKLWFHLYGSKKIYIAALNGHSMALGCLVAIACDYRIMSCEAKNKIGLSASQLGITPPSWIKDTMVNTIGHRQAELALQKGYSYSPEEALKIKLVDEIVPIDEVLKTAEARMKDWCKIPTEARSISKRMMRQSTLDRFTLNSQFDLDSFVGSISSASVQESIKNYLKNMKNQHKYF